MHRFLVIIFFLFSLSLAGCGGGGGGNNDDGGHHVTYEVSSYSTQLFDITYTDENGDSQTVTNVPVTEGWSKSFSAPGGSLLSLSATMHGLDNDTYWVNIYVDYVKVNQMNQNWPGTPATIEYSIP